MNEERRVDIYRSFIAICNHAIFTRIRCHVGIYNQESQEALNNP
jgi:hypothetical protein